ncbi:MAG: glucose-6-phosphate isomerase [Candidatus Saccharibacteria bacterium]|nr:glucose-6-phosphate isomerase [Candidatus Saccharibacteria bacterium]
MIKLNFSPEIDEKAAAGLLREIAKDPMGGWLNLPKNIDMGEFVRIKEAAKEIQDSSEYLVCIGIGGSYLGHRAIIEALRPHSDAKIIYAGNSLSRRELDYALEKVGDHDFSINVISKSGTTLEPAVAFNEFKKKLIEKYGEEGAYARIYATTDAKKGALHDEAVACGYTRFVVPDNIGGRYSVLTAVGLLPMAVAGVDIDKLLEGASDAVTTAVEPAVKYATMRHTLDSKHYDTEVFASFEPATMYFNEWLKQLFGESEGKDKRGILPDSVIYSTDLHSLGQYIQDGRRNLFETIIDYPTDEMNAKVVKAVQIAHAEGGIPVLTIGVPSYDERGFGELIYFFELACALSAKMMGVNPFDQPGVEAYKAKLNELL